MYSRAGYSRIAYSDVTQPASSSPATGKLFLQSLLNGLGAGGPFYRSPLGAIAFLIAWVS